MLTNPEELLGLGCPSGGEFYVCSDSSSRFVGCCTSDACKTSNGECPSHDLRAATFDASKYDQIYAQDCAPVKNHTAAFYTCSSDDPPFLGCCLSNACALGACPDKDLIAIKLSSNPAHAAVFLPHSTTTESSTSQTGLPSRTSSSASSTNSSSGSDSGGGRSSPPPSAIAGITIGSLAAALLAVVGISLYILRKRKKAQIIRSSPGYPLQHEQTSSPMHAPITTSFPVAGQTGPQPPYRFADANSPQSYSSPLYEEGSPITGDEIEIGLMRKQPGQGTTAYAAELPADTGNRRLQGERNRLKHEVYEPPMI